MANWFKRLWNDKRGNAVILAGASLPLIVASAGFATDTIQWTLWKRQLQRAADSSAMAGVYATVAGQTSSSAITNDLVYNQNTGMTLSSGYPIVTYPADTADWDHAIKVQLAVSKPLSFSGMFGQTPLITASATAAIADSGKYCVISLESSSTTGIIDTGNATLDLGCGMITNSTSLNAAIAAGSATVNASPIAAVGGIQAAKQWGNSTLLPFTVAQADPYANVQIDPSAVTGCVADPKVGPGGSGPLSPGCYKGLTLNGPVTLNPGTYYIDGGTSSSNPNGFDLGAQANVIGNGVTIVLTNANTGAQPIGNLTMNGSAQLNLTAPQTGTYAGIAMYQDRRAVDDGSTSSSPNLINGNSNSTLKGAFYFPNQQVGFNGNGGLTTNCFQLVSRRVEFKGNMKITNTCPSTDASQAYQGRHVRLVS